MSPRLTPSSRMEILFTLPFPFRFPLPLSPRSLPPQVHFRSPLPFLTSALKGADFSCFFNNCDALVVQFTRCKCGISTGTRQKRALVYYTTVYPSCQALFFLFPRFISGRTGGKHVLFFRRLCSILYLPLFVKGFPEVFLTFLPAMPSLSFSCIFSPPVVY